MDKTRQKIESMTAEIVRLRGECARQRQLLSRAVSLLVGFGLLVDRVKRMLADDVRYHSAPHPTVPFSSNLHLISATMLQYLAYQQHEDAEKVAMAQKLVEEIKASLKEVT